MVVIGNSINHFGKYWVSFGYFIVVVGILHNLFCILIMIEVDLTSFRL